MFIQAWNIQAGGGTRLPAVLDCIAQHAADTLVLGETTSTRFESLTSSLRRLGYSAIHAERPRGAERGVLVASKIAFEIRKPSASKVTAERWAEVWFPRHKFGLAGVYAPDSPAGIAAFWPRIHEAASTHREGQYLLLGDLNAGHAVFDSEYGVLHGDPWFTAMPYHGMFDVWRHKNRAAQEYTWFSVNRGVSRGCRLDHAFATAALRRRVREARYSHAERESGVSDHSSLLLRVH